MAGTISRTEGHTSEWCIPDCHIWLHPETEFILTSTATTNHCIVGNPERQINPALVTAFIRNGVKLMVKFEVKK